MVNLQIIKTPDGEDLAVLPLADYKRLEEAAEDLEDILLYDEAKQRIEDGEEELIPHEFVVRLLDGESPVRVWREFRGLTAAALAEKAGISAAYLSQIEGGQREGKIGTMKALAEVLGITVDDLV